MHCVQIHRDVDCPEFNGGQSYHLHEVHQSLCLEEVVLLSLAAHAYVVEELPYDGDVVGHHALVGVHVNANEEEVHLPQSVVVVVHQELLRQLGQFFVVRIHEGIV